LRGPIEVFWALTAFTGVGQNSSGKCRLGGSAITENVLIGWVVFGNSIISAKWAADLGFSQLRQLLWGIAGLFAGPLVLLILYLRLLRKAKASAQRWF
jgi:hypothetical protein